MVFSKSVTLTILNRYGLLKRRNYIQDRKFRLFIIYGIYTLCMAKHNNDLRDTWCSDGTDIVVTC